MTGLETIRNINRDLNDEQMKKCLMGFFVGWSLSGVKTTKDEALKAAEKYGILQYLKVPNITPPCAYLRAVKEVTKGINDTKQYEAVLLETTDEKQVHAIVERSVIEQAIQSGQIQSDNDEGFVAGKSAKFEEVCRVGFDKKKYMAGGVPSECFVAGDENAFSQKIYSEYHKACDVIKANDVRIAFQRAFEEWCGVRVIDHGGMWWIPAHRADEVEAWSMFLRQLGGHPVMIPIFCTDDAKASMKRMAAQSAQAQIASMKMKVERFDEKTRNSSIETRIKEMGELRNRMEVWKRYFEIETGDLESAIKDLEKKGVDMLMSREEEVTDPAE